MHACVTACLRLALMWICFLSLMFSVLLRFFLWVLKFSSLHKIKLCLTPSVVPPPNRRSQIDHKQSRDFSNEILQRRSDFSNGIFHQSQNYCLCTQNWQSITSSLQIATRLSQEHAYIWRHINSVFNPWQINIPQQADVINCDQFCRCHGIYHDII